MPNDPADPTEYEAALLRELYGRVSTVPFEPPPKATVEFVPWEPTAEELRHAAPLWPERFTEDHLRALRAKHGPRYIPDLSEVPPDPADPIAIGVDPGHDGGTRVSVWAVKPDPTGKMRPTLIAVSDAVAACPDPAHPCIVSVGVGNGPPPDVGMPNHATLHLKPRSASAVLSAHRRFVGEHLHRITGAGRPADGDPPRIARPPLTDVEITAALEHLRRDIEQAGGRLEVRYEEPAPQPKEEGLARIRAARADLLLFANQFEQARESDAVRIQWERASAAAAKLPVGHGKSLLWAGLLDELERAKEPPQLPTSPVVQAALVVDPTDPLEEP